MDEQATPERGAAEREAARRLAPVVRIAHAKVNLTLAVVGRRPDGYHSLHSIMVQLGIGDRLSLASAAGRADSLHVVGHDAGPLEDNLVLRAIGLARSAVGRERPTPFLAARLEKRIPVAAGLAGGSSDAAAALDAALEAWGAALDAPTLQELAARLGSDVPFFLAGGTALVEGRGEHVTPLRGIVGEPPGILLVTPAIASPTPAVFEAYATGGVGAPADRGATRLSSEHLAAELGRGMGARELLARAGVLASANDLANAAAVVVPGLRELRRVLLRRLARPVGLSGSGPTLWALYASEAEAVAAAADLDAAVAAGDLATPGGRPPSIVATTILTDRERRDHA